MFLKGKVILNEQECTGNSDFSIRKRYMTAGFQNVFGNESRQIASAAICLIMETYPHGADYLQTFKPCCFQMNTERSQGHADQLL